jgi:hypothetical protein
MADTTNMNQDNKNKEIKEDGYDNLHEYEEKFSTLFSNCQYKEALDLSVKLWTEICSKNIDDSKLVSIVFNILF